MIVLAIETSQRPGSLAIYADESLVAECQIEVDGRRQAQSIVVVAQELLAEQELKLRDVMAVACSLGPGSFTGLRVGLTFAKSLAFANDCPLVGVPTLAVLAHQLPQQAQYGAAVVDAQRGEVFVQLFKRADSHWTATGQVEIRNAEEWAESQSEHIWLIGPGRSVFPSEALDRFQSPASGVETPSATWVGQLGLARLLRGERDDPAMIEPLYLRRSAAEEKANQKK